VDVQYQQLLLDLIPGLICIDNEGKIVYANRMMADHWKVNREKMIGFPIEKFYPHSKMPESIRANQDRRLVWYQGEEAYGDVEASLHSLIKKDGEVVGYGRCKIL